MAPRRSKKKTGATEPAPSAPAVAVAAATATTSSAPPAANGVPSSTNTAAKTEKASRAAGTAPAPATPPATATGVTAAAQKKKKKRKPSAASATQAPAAPATPTEVVEAPVATTAVGPASAAPTSDEQTPVAVSSRRKNRNKNKKNKNKNQQQQQLESAPDEKPAAAAAVSPQMPPAPATALKTRSPTFPLFAPDTPAMGFAPPHAALTSDVRAFFDSVIDATASDAARAHLVDHMRRGLAQMDAFVQQQHTDASGNAFSDFEALVARDSEVWAQHVATARESADMGVQDRTLQPSLRLALAGMDLKAGRPGRPDDAVYAKSAYARAYMPRGNFIATWTSPSSGKTLHFPIVRAYRKFTGQEDDGEEHGALGDDVLSKFFTKPKEQTRHVISTTKENGEAGHLAVLKRADGAFVFALGSKNTHLLALSLDDVDAACAAGRQDGNDPYKAAAPIARALLRMLAQLTPAHRLWLCELLWQTRMTASFEILCPSHQHVQLLDYIDDDTPVFYGVSLPSYAHMAGAEICVNPVLLYEAMRALGVRTVEYSVVEYTPAVYDATLTAIKQSYQHEGAVNLFVDADACVIGMEKFKTVWYVSLRAIREKAKGFCNKLYPRRPAQHGTARATVLAESKKQISKRFVAIKAFVDVSSDVASAYAALGHRFVEYLASEKLPLGTSADDVKRVKTDVAERFPVVWKQFLDATGTSDVVAYA